MTRKKEVFRPFNKNKVTMFVCGPTVYDHSHLGHARTYIAYDIIARYLRFRGFNLFYVMNITDVDDKIINRAKERGIHPLELAREFEKSFFEDIKALGIEGINKFARASEHIKEIISQVERLMKKGYAYVTKTGVYFDVAKFKDYGKLSHQNLEELKKHRIEPDPTKKNPQDFALWKFQKPGELSWDSPWGKGRPGWHIEDTAIAEKYLGHQYDIHGGAIDLIFPHHESEIAQMEALSGKKPMVKYWIHTGFLRVNGQKMAKSLGNFITIKDALKKTDPEALRLFFAFTHYRSPIDFNKRNLEQSEKSLESLYNALEGISSLETKESSLNEDEKKLKEKIRESKKKFIEYMDDDFNAPSALAVLFALAKEFNKFSEKNKKINKTLLKEAISTFRELGSIFNILQREIKEEKLPKELLELIKKREEARKRKDWKTADSIRAELREKGIILEDTPEGTKWKIVKK